MSEKSLEKNEIFDSYFKNLSDRERAVFEGGISLGALFHQFVGTPVSEKTKKSLEIAMSESLKNQPFIEDVSVSIIGKIEDGKYVSLTGEMLDVSLTVKTEKNRALLRLKYIKELDYPLMYVEKI
ncbi:dihydroneopterin aldolase family protein [Methanococcus maripaludis]|uniref:Dihydroneopterin aldolase n=1 Tax=Methanococcus maripaludis TaxID=39152 RepID=A0A8T3VXV8_METMI|nr:dihydroneopterin aldolase family protein [Methanococcus maripaludis]MBG0769456.1 dihydroneopterin aldolase family protein [Methanococcus maripaludis]